MLYPVFDNVPPWNEGMEPRQIAVIIGQFLDTSTLDKFKDEIEKSPLAPPVKHFVQREFHPGCSITEAVKYMSNYHIESVRSIGFMFDWVLRHKELRKQRMGQ